MSGDEDIISSISKGCFFFKPEVEEAEIPKRSHKRVKSKKRKRETHSQVNTADYLRTFNKKENEGERRRRFDTYFACWEELSSQIKEVQDSLNETIFKDLLEFVTGANIRKKETHAITEIPTAALITGVNIPDHQVFFSKFVNILKENVSPFVAQLQSKDCSNLKSLIKEAFDSLVWAVEEHSDNGGDFLSDDDDDHDIPIAKRYKKSSIFRKYTFTELKEWYTDYCMKNNSTVHIVDEDSERELEIKNNSTIHIVNEDCERELKIVIETGAENDSLTVDSMVDGAVPPVVFIFEDFERFSSAVLQDFVLICSEYIADVPIVLLFGVTTAVNSVHRLLPHFVSSKLSIQKFQSQPSLVCLTKVIDKVIITNRNAFKLGPRVFRLLYEHFLYHDFSVNNFVRSLKFCVMEHFNAHPSSVMCSKDQDDITDYVCGCNGSKIVCIKEIPSFKRHIEKKSEKEQQKLQNDNTSVQNLFINAIKRLQAQEHVFYPMVKCLYACASMLPTHPMGKWLRDVYEYCMISANITKEKKFHTVISLLRVLARDDFLSILQSCESILQGVTSLTKKTSPLQSEVDALKKFMERFNDLDNMAAEEVENDEKPVDKKSQIPIYKTRYEFTEKLKMAVKEKKKENPYEKLRTSVVDYLESMFKKHLQSPLSMTGHEIFYYDDVQNVRRRLNGTPRIAIQNALSNPKCYLNCSCCPSGGDEINGNMPDVCILYKLHLESGRLINLYDWLQAFICFIDPTIADEKKNKSQKKKKLVEQLQARFIRGISELQFLGFIKGTRRKTDHVSRLTWGGC